VAPSLSLRRKTIMSVSAKTVTYGDVLRADLARIEDEIFAI